MDEGGARLLETCMIYLTFRKGGVLCRNRGIIKEKQ